MDNYLNITESDLLTNVPKKYYFEENRTKFIYSNLEKEVVTALSNNIQNEVIEVKKEKKLNKKTMSYISLNDQAIGWIHLENSKRVYRLPNIQGKFKKQRGIERQDAPDAFTDRIVKASYILFDNSTPSLLVKKVGSDKYLNIAIDDFHRANIPEEKLTIKLKKGTPLYKDSEFIRIDGHLDEDTDCNVVTYFEKLDEIRVQVNSKYYWVKKEHDFKINVSDIKHINYEVIDMLVYYKHTNKKDKITIQNKNNRLKNIESNIVISNDFEEMYLKKYIGDADESQ